LATEGFDEDFAAHDRACPLGNVQRFMVLIQRLLKKQLL